MTCDFTSFSTVIQSHQDDNKRLCEIELHLRLKIFPPSAGLEQQVSAELAKKWMKLRRWVG